MLVKSGNGCGTAIRHKIVALLLTAVMTKVVAGGDGGGGGNGGVVVVVLVIMVAVDDERKEKIRLESFARESAKRVSKNTKGREKKKR